MMENDDSIVLMMIWKVSVWSAHKNRLLKLTVNGGLRLDFKIEPFRMVFDKAHDFHRYRSFNMGCFGVAVTEWLEFKYYITFDTGFAVPTNSQTFDFFFRFHLFNLVLVLVWLSRYAAEINQNHFYKWSVIDQKYERWLKNTTTTKCVLNSKKKKNNKNQKNDEKKKNI